MKKIKEERQLKNTVDSIKKRETKYIYVWKTRKMKSEEPQRPMNIQEQERNKKI